MPHALINITENIRKALDDGNMGCGVFVDLQKAFHTVDHQILLAKLNHYAIRGVSNDWFKSYLSNWGLLGVTWGYSGSGATRAVALDIFKAFDRVWHAGLLHKLKSYRISGQILGLISSFLSNSRLRVVLDGKSSQEYPVNASVPHKSILGPTLFLLYINGLPDNVICNIAIYADDTTLYSKCNQASDL